MEFTNRYPGGRERRNLYNIARRSGAHNANVICNQREDGSPPSVNEADLATGGPSRTAGSVVVRIAILGQCASTLCRLPPLVLSLRSKKRD